MSASKRRFLTVAGVVLGACVLVPVADRVWFDCHVPADFSGAAPRGAHWRGDWSSERFGLVSGRLLANLPDPIPTDEDFEVDAFVSYRLWSPYRPGGTTRLKMVGRFAPDHTGGGDNDDAPLRVPPRFTFQFKGGPGSSLQTIEYIATSDAEHTMIVGGYRSDGPFDLGRFMLVRQ